LISNKSESEQIVGVAMRIKTMFRVLSAAALLAVCFSPAMASCLKPPASDEAISKFKSDPQAVIAPGADTRIIETTTRDLVGTDASLAAEFIRLAKKAPPRFKTAIAAGLAQAAIACSGVDQNAALLIQQAVAEFQDGQFQASFAAVAGDLSTAATAAATASAASSIGSVIASNPNPGGNTATPGSGGAVTSLVQLTAPGITLSTDSTNSSSASAADPVSATQ
jgi:hypothetical protein